ncbi:hypothetical protein CFP56_036590 [Quercus suber]|uniref:Uncharacterized protein n=1 Tax=Quercus suber TaxID=58331 RepID=A0AAW0J7U7_QUESU
MAMDALMGPRVIKQETVASSASDVPPAPNTNGLAWGTGTSIAHMAMDALMGPRVIKQETVASSASDVPPAPNTNGVGSSTVCADQFKALIDSHYEIGKFSLPEPPHTMAITNEVVNVELSEYNRALKVSEKLAFSGHLRA